MSDTVAEFLVSLGWVSDKSGQDAFEDAIESATLRAKLLGDMIEELARKMLDSVGSVAVNYNKLYFAAERTNTAASTIGDFSAAMEKISGMGDLAAGAIDSVAMKLKENKGNIYYANQLGFGLNPLSGQLEIQDKLLDGLKNIDDSQLKLVAELGGMPAVLAFAVKNHVDDLKAYIAKLRDYRAALGFDQKQAQADAHAYSLAVSDVAAQLTAMYEFFTTKLEAALVGPLKEFTRVLDENAPDIGKNIDKVTKAIGEMTGAWVKDFEEIVKNPHAYDDFRTNMSALGTTIATMATNFAGFVGDLKWLWDKGKQIADILNHLTGQKEGGGGWDSLMQWGIDNLPGDNSGLERFKNGGGGGGRGGGSGAPAVGGYPRSSSAGNLTKLIDAAAAKEGIDPRMMEGIRAGESGHGANYDKKDDALESSWGPFQLNRKRGLGVEFEKDTGLDVRDPSTIPAQAAWVAHYLKVHGPNGQWSGYAGNRDADPRWGDSGYVPKEGEPGFVPYRGGAAPAGKPYAAGDVDAARDYLRSTASGNAATREHYIGGLHPDFVLKMANAIKQARAAGLSNAGIFSGARTPGDHPSAFDRSGMSTHPVGLSSDVGGIGAAGSAESALWNKIATGAGLFNPYGPDNANEWNHYQDIPDRKIDPTGPMAPFYNNPHPAKRQEMWDAASRAYGLPMPSAADPAGDALWNNMPRWGGVLGGVFSGGSPLGGAAPAGDTSIHAPMKTDIIVNGDYGAGAPTPSMIGANINHDSMNLTSGSQGAHN